MFSLLATPVISLSEIIDPIFPSEPFRNSSWNARKTTFRCFHSIPSLIRALPSFITATPPLPIPSFSLVVVVVRERAGAALLLDRMLVPERVDAGYRLGSECIEWLPGIPVVEGIVFRRGLSVGGRGAGPGFMNWPGV